MAMMGIDTILQHLANASGALERTSRPGIKEVKEAAGSAKIAADLLKASEVFLSNGIYVICDEPACAYVDPAAHKIEMPEVAHIELDVPAELPQLPEELALFPTWDEAEQLEEFDRRLNALADLVPEHIYPPWEQAWDADALDAFTRLLAAEAREPKSFTVPTDEERDAWLAKFAPAPEQDPTPCCDFCGQTAVHADDCAFSGAVGEAPAEEPSASPKATLAEFQADLDRLEEAGVEQGLKRKDWKKANKAWWVAYDQDADATFAKLRGLLDRQGCAWEIPADPEPVTTEGGVQ